MTARKLHFAGAVRTPRMMILAGWAACCSGYRAEQIREEGRNTHDREAVTCRACLRVMAKETPPARGWGLIPGPDGEPVFGEYEVSE